MSSSSSSRPPSVNLRCHEQVLLLDSPTTTTTNVVDADDSSQPPRRYYFLFGQNSNQLSIERERFHRISLRAQNQQQQQQQQVLEDRRNSSGNRRPMSSRHSTAGAGQQVVAAETPKNGAKVLASIDGNIPFNGSRLTHYPHHHHHQQQRSVLLAPVPNNGIHGSITTRKRRADDAEADQRLNMKERVWVCADVDRAIHLDTRTLHSMLEAEKAMTVSAAQIRREQEEPQQREDGDTDKGIQEWARTKAVEWMQEVCEAEQADFVILPLAVAFLDRMLACRFVPRRNLQALASACLLLASKMRAPQPMTANKLSDQTDNFVRMEELLDWEMLVLNHLQWNLLQSTPFEFFDQLLVRWPVLEALREDFALTLHRMQKVLHLATQLPSVQASACLLFVAVRSRKKHLLSESEQGIRKHLGIDPVSTLVPLFDDIASAFDGDGSANGAAAEAQRQYSLNVTAEHQQLKVFHPPSSKRMSMGEERQHQSATAALHQSKLPVLWRRTKEESSVLQACPDPAPTSVDGLPVVVGSPPDGQQMEDEASRSSSSSNSNASSSGGGGAKSNNGTLVNDSGFHSSHSDTSHCCDEQAGMIAEGSNTGDMAGMGRPRLELDRKAKDFGQLW